MQSYILVFVTTGLFAVAFKYLGDHSASRLAGLVAMMPLKILTAWAIIGSAKGGEGIRETIGGMVVGLVAMVVLLAIGWLVAPRIGTLWTVTGGAALWLATALAVNALIARP